MTTDHDDTDFEPAQAACATDHVLTELQLFGYRPFQDEPDPRPLPEATACAGAVYDMFDALSGALSDTRISPYVCLALSPAMLTIQQSRYGVRPRKGEQRWSSLAKKTISST